MSLFQGEPDRYVVVVINSGSFGIGALNGDRVSVVATTSHHEDAKRLVGAMNRDLLRDEE